MLSRIKPLTTHTNRAALLANKVSMNWLEGWQIKRRSTIAGRFWKALPDFKKAIGARNR
jgi:hypothetical protein